MSCSRKPTLQRRSTTKANEQLEDQDCKCPTLCHLLPSNRRFSPSCRFSLSTRTPRLHYLPSRRYTRAGSDADRERESVNIVLISIFYVSSSVQKVRPLRIHIRGPALGSGNRVACLEDLNGPSLDTLMLTGERFDFAALQVHMAMQVLRR